MFGPGGGGVYEVCGDEDMLCEGPDWMAACGGLGKEFRYSYLDAVAQLAARLARNAGASRKLIASLIYDDIALRVVALAAEDGEFPGWWPARLPHLRIELREARAPEAEPELFYADPNRSGLGVELAWRRVKLWLMAQPVPYAGRIAVKLTGPDGGRSLGGLRLWFEVNTAGQPGDPGAREAMVSLERQARRSHRELLAKMAQSKHLVRERRLMHGQVGGVVRAAADAMRAAQGLPPAPDKPVEPGLLDRIGRAALPFLKVLAVQYLPAQLPRVLHVVRQELGPEVVEQLARDLASQIEPQILVVLVQQAKEVLGDEGLNEALGALGLPLDFAAEQPGDEIGPEDVEQEDRGGCGATGGDEPVSSLNDQPGAGVSDEDEFSDGSDQPGGDQGFDTFLSGLFDELEKD